jgi:arabinofuranosyltransferase
MGFYAGPQVHAFDPMALSDAFVARLPPKAPRQRIGHIERIIPAEYIRSRITNRNQFTDQDSAHLYDDIMVITTGKLFSADRWRAIVRLNSGETEWLRRN